MADNLAAVTLQFRAGEAVQIDAGKGRGYVEVAKARAGFTDVARHRRQQGHRAHDVAAGRLSLQTLSAPQQRRAGTVPLRRLLYILRRYAGGFLAPFGRCLIDEFIDLVSAMGMQVDKPTIEVAVFA